MARREPRIERLKIGKYTLATDQTMNWILTETSKSRGKKSQGQDVTRTVGYYPKLEHALEKMLQLKLMRADVNEIQYMLESLAVAKSQIVEAARKLDKL